MTPTDNKLIDRDKLNEIVESVRKVQRKINPYFSVKPNSPSREADQAWKDCLDSTLDMIYSILSSSPLVEEKKEATIKAGGFSFWWCPNCEEEVDGSRVTFEEHHDKCGACVVAVTQKPLVVPQAEPPRAKEDDPDTYAAGYRDGTANGLHLANSAPSVPERKVTPDEVWELAHRLCMQSTRGAMLNQYRDWLRALPRESGEETRPPLDEERGKP
jgi:hypothetical protein